VKYVVKEFWRDPERYADRVYVSADTFAVADGMGFGEGGKLAAEKAIQLLDRSRPFKSVEELESFFTRTNREIMKEIARLGDRYVAGTTLSVLSFAGRRYLIGHVGDSRIYLFREGYLDLLTEDQIRFRGGKKYVSALGLEWYPRVYLREGYFERGDIFLLISDGAVYTFSDSELEIFLSEDIEESARRLFERYLETIPREDLSFVIVRAE